MSDVVGGFKGRRVSGRTLLKPVLLGFDAESVYAQRTQLVGDLEFLLLL